MVTFLHLILLTANPNNMQRLVILLLVFSFSAQAQKKPSLPAMPNLASLQKMTPAQIEAYKKKMQKQLSQQARAMSKEYNLKIDRTLLPDFDVELPPRDGKRLALIPKQPPTLLQLADGLRRAKAALASVTPKPILDEVKKIEQSQTPAQQQNTSIAAFYSDKPAEALLLSMNSALQNMAEPMAWNNLAAMFNLTKLEHRAIPILMNQLQQFPKSAMLLNNMGQAYLGLGDVANAEVYLKRCLVEDPLHPEANRSMGMIRFFQKQFAEGTNYFEKELEISHRRSTLARLKQKGQPANLYNLRKRRPDLPQRNHFEEISLSKFVIPDFPPSCDETKKVTEGAKSFLMSASQEQLFWYKEATTSTEADKQQMQYKTVSVYADLVQELLDGLNSTFPAENLTLFTEADIQELAEKRENYWKRKKALQFPPPPSPMTEESREAYEKVCCEINKALNEEFMLDYNKYVANRIAIVHPRWKNYLNSLISIVRYDPSPGNKALVYGTVANYFLFLQTAWQSGEFQTGCKDNLSLEEAIAVIESSRQIDFSCPSWLQFNVGLGVASLSGNCGAFSVSGGELFQWAYEKNFQTGTSTIAGGVGVGASFGSIFSASAGHMLYLTYDNNNQFVDLGLRGGASVGAGLETEALVTGEIGKISREIGGIGSSYSLGIHSGFVGTIESTGILSEFIKVEATVN